MNRTDRSSGTYSPFQAVEAQPLRALITDENEGRTRLAPTTEGGPRQVHGALQSRLHLYHGAYQSVMEQDTSDPAVGEEMTTFFCLGPPLADNPAYCAELIGTVYGTSRRQGLALYITQKGTG
jgi:hypothetical protein